MKINCKAVVLALIVFAVSSSAESLISDFISSARNLWPKTKGNKSCCARKDEIFTKENIFPQI